MPELAVTKGDHDQSLVHFVTHSIGPPVDLSFDLIQESAQLGGRPGIGVFRGESRNRPTERATHSPRLSRH